MVALFFHILDPVDGNFADKCLILKEKPTASAFEEICSPARHHVFIAVKKFIFFRNGTLENNSVRNGILEKFTWEMVL